MASTAFDQLCALCDPDEQPAHPATQPEEDLACHIAVVIDNFKRASEQQNQALAEFLTDRGICNAFMKLLRPVCSGSNRSNKDRQARHLVCLALQSIYAQFHPDASLTRDQAKACYKFATCPLAASDYTTRPNVADATDIADTWRTFFTNALQAQPTQEEVTAATANVDSGAAAAAADTNKQRRARATQSVPNISARTDSRRFACPCVCGGEGDGGRVAGGLVWVGVFFFFAYSICTSSPLTEDMEAKSAQPRKRKNSAPEPDSPPGKVPKNDTLRTGTKELKADRTSVAKNGEAGVVPARVRIEGGNGPPPYCMEPSVLHKIISEQTDFHCTAQCVLLDIASCLSPFLPKLENVVDGVNIFGEHAGKNDPLRKMCALDTTPDTPFGRCLNFVARTLGQWRPFEDFIAAVITTKGGSKRQELHTDFPSESSLPSYACIIALQSNTTLDMLSYPGKNVVKINIPIGYACVFRRSAIHAGSGYTKKNTRIYMAFRAKGDVLPQNTVYAIKL